MPRKPRSNYIAPVLPQRALTQAVRIVPPPQREDAAENEGAKSRRSGRIDDEKFAAIVRNAIETGADYDEDQLQPDRLKAWRFYKGDISDLPPNENGSSVVSYDVRDMVHAVMPSLERIFFSSDCPVEFLPERPRDEDSAPLMTKYINKLVRDRLGILGIRNVMMDVALSKIGCVMWWWDDSERVITERFTGLGEAEFGFATDVPDKQTTVKVVEKTQRQVPPDPEAVEMAKQMIAAGENVPMPQPATVTDCLIRYTTTTRKLRIEAFPPEERIIDPDARSVETAGFRGRRTIKKVHELVALGYDRDDVLEHATMDPDTDPSLSQDSAVRQPQGFNEVGDDAPDEDYRDVQYCELWIKCDRDDDGIAELLKVCTLGDSYEIVHEEAASQVCMAEFQMMPMPHTVTGRALADNLIDIQTIKTGLWRGVMESIVHSIYPRFSGVEGRVNWDDLLSNAPGQPIRIKGGQDAVEQFKVDFVGDAALSVMTFVDENIRDQRTGVSKAAQGLDPDALQSTPSVAAAAMIGATQSQLEDYARMLGATGFRELYRGLLREVVTNQRDPDWMKVNDRWVEIDPRPWNAELDVSIDVTGGTHGAAQKLPVLQAVAAAQTTAMTQLGPDNPLVGLQEIYNTQSKIIELSGIGRTDQFWKDPRQMPGWKPPAPPGQAAQQDPNAAAAALAQADVKKAQIVDDTKRYQISLEDDRARDKTEADVVLRAMEITAKSGVVIDPTPIINAMRLPRPPSTLPAPPNPQSPPPGPPAPPMQHP